MWRIWFAALFWGLNWPAVKIMLGGVSPWTLRAAGLGGGFLVLMTILVLSGRRVWPQRTAWRGIGVGGILNIAGFNICAVFAQLAMPTSRAAIVTFTMPIWAQLFGWLWLGERLDWVRSVALTLGAIGLGLLAVPFWPQIVSGEVPVGLVFALGAAISWALGTVYFKARPIPGEPLVAVAWQVFVGALICVVGMVALETPRFDLTEPKRLVAFVYHITLPQALCYLAWFSLLTRVTASTAALGTLLIPIFGVLGAVVILDDRPTILDIAGLALILLAVGADTFLRHRRARALTKTHGG